MANVVYLSKTLVSGGTAPALDSIDGTGLVDGDFAHVTVAGVLYVYKLNATSGAAESIPTIISPDTNAGTKRWILQGINANGLVDNSLTASLPLFSGASKELVSKSVADTITALGLGVWTTPAYSAAYFTAGTPMTWTVEATDVITFAYTIIGKLMILSVDLETTSLITPASTVLYIAIPGDKTATKTMATQMLAYDNGAWISLNVSTSAGSTLISLYKLAGGNYTLSSNACYVKGQIAFEIN